VCDILLQRRSQQIVQQILSPQEQPGLQVPRAHLDEYIALIQTLVPLVPAELIHNLDETNLNDCEECRDKRVLVPAHVAESAFYYLVDSGI
jgi:hypothetical protein